MLYCLDYCTLFEIRLGRGLEANFCKKVLFGSRQRIELEDLLIGEDVHP